MWNDVSKVFDLLITDFHCFVSGTSYALCLPGHLCLLEETFMVIIEEPKDCLGTTEEIVKL